MESTIRVGGVEFVSANLWRLHIPIRAGGVEFVSAFVETTIRVGGS